MVNMPKNVSPLIVSYAISSCKSSSTTKNKSCSTLLKLVYVSMLLRKFTSFNAMPLYIAYQIQPVREGTRMQKETFPTLQRNHRSNEYSLLLHPCFSLGWIAAMIVFWMTIFLLIGQKKGCCKIWTKVWLSWVGLQITAQCAVKKFCKT